MAELENGWYISSTDDPNLEYVIDNGNGKYTFKPKAGGKTYEITYVEDGKTGTTIYTPNTEECNPCYKETTFNGWAGPNSFSPFPSAGGTAKVVYNLGECWEVKVVRNTKNATAVTTSQTSSSISVAKNETTAAIISEVEYEFKNKYVPTATKNETVKIYQQSKCSTDTECPEVSPAEKHIGKEESDVEVTFTEGCWILTDKYLTMDGQPVSDDVAKFTTNKIIHVYENKASNSRTIVAEYIFTNNALGRVCNRFVEITQEEGCNCSNVTYEVVKSSFTHEGGSAKIGNLTTCDRNKTSIEVKSGSSYITSGPAIAQEPQSGVYPVSITVKSNETRDTTYHVKYVINFNGQQCKPGESETPPYYDLIIEPKGCTCDCNYLKRIDKDKPYFFPTKDTNPGRPTLTNQILKELVMKDGFSSHCTYEDLEPYAIDTGITRIWTAVTGNILEIRGDIADITKEGEYKRALRFGLKVCGNDCNILNPPFYVFQRCYCGTDDCRNEYNIEGGGTVVEDHPMYMGGCVENGWPSDWPRDRYPFPKYPNGKYHGDADSVFVNSLYVVPMKPVNGVLQPMYATANNPEGKVKLFHTVNGEFIADGSTFYWPDHRTTNKPVLVTYNEQGYPLGISIDVNTTRPMIGVASLIGAKTASTSSVTITYDEDGNTENVQMYTWLDDETKSLISENTKWEVLLTTDEDVTVAGPNPGTNCCKEFITTIYQAKKGYRYNKDYRIDDMATLEQCP